MNSLVLKQASPFAEWYHRALAPCQHYIEFWRRDEEDVVPLLRALQDSPANQATAQRIAAAAQAFAAAYLGEEARWQYWQLVFDRYAELYKKGGGVVGGGGSGEGAVQQRDHG